MLIAYSYMMLTLNHHVIWYAYKQSITYLGCVLCSVALEVGGRNPALIPTVTTRVLNTQLTPKNRDLT